MKIVIGVSASVALIGLGFVWFRTNGIRSDLELNNGEEFLIFDNSYFPLIFKYPADWERVTSGDEEAFPLPTITDSVVSPADCKLEFGFGGGDGPSADDIVDKKVFIDGTPFLKRTWVSNDEPIFISFIEQKNLKNFELMFVWVSDENKQECLSQIDDIVDSIHFLK